MPITVELLGTLGGKGHYSYRADPQEAPTLGVYEPVQMTLEKGTDVVPPGTYWVVVMAGRVGTPQLGVRCNGRTATLTANGPVILIAEEMTFTSPWTPLVEFSGSSSLGGNRRIREVSLILTPL